MYNIIDSIPLGNVPCEGFKVTYNGDIPEHNPPSWMMKTFEVWFWNPLQLLEAQIGNPDFNGEMDYAPKQVLGRNGKCQFTDLQSGDWAWEQSVCLYLLNLNSMNIIFLGWNCEKPFHSWGCLFSSNSQERQNYSFSCYWAKWILSALCFNWDYPESCLSRAPK